jgi:glycosyltransferase involved in cell wall biosynthesis
MIRVAALTSGRHVPSSRFRIRQFIAPLATHGIVVAESWPLISKYFPSPRFARGVVGWAKVATRLPGIVSARRSDVTWLGRELVPRRRTAEHLAGRVRLFDVDDAIWLTARTSFSEEIVAECYGLIAGNHFIADHYRDVARRIWVVPTCVDTREWSPPAGRDPHRWTVGWTGTSSNLEYLTSLDEPIAAFLSRYARAELLVVCDRKPRFRWIPPARWRFMRWSPSIERAAVQQMNVGLMPLPDTAWARGKCGFKLLLYMATGIPVIASPIGVNDLLLKAAPVGAPAIAPEEWTVALTRLIEDPDGARSAGVAGRRLVEERYSVAANVGRLADIFREAARNE